MKKRPFQVLDEANTLSLCEANSLARFGDGELRLATGGQCSSQRAHPELQRELRMLLGHDMMTGGPMVGIPNFAKTPNRKTWDKYEGPQYAPLYGSRTYCSAFITRPDNAPWIDTPEYWDQVRQLWAGEKVTLVCGDRKSLTPEMLVGAGPITEIIGPRQHAYEEINRIEEEIGKPSGVVLMCLGATATVLAARLDRKDVHALDLGHIGMFMKHAGAYQFKSTDLASADYKAQLQAKHKQIKWGRSGDSHAPEVSKFALTLGATTVLDYGCGQGRLRPAVPQLRVFEYDPGIPGKDQLPKPADIVVSTDVLEHIEPENVDNVLRHIFLLAKRGAYLVISLSLARELLPDGRNAHLTVKPAEWWTDKIKACGWASVKSEQRKGLCVWLRK